MLSSNLASAIVQCGATKVPHNESPQEEEEDEISVQKSKVYRIYFPTVQTYFQKHPDVVLNELDKFKENHDLWVTQTTNARTRVTTRLAPSRGEQLMYSSKIQPNRTFVPSKNQSQQKASKAKRKITSLALVPRRLHKLALSVCNKKSVGRPPHHKNLDIVKFCLLHAIPFRITKWMFNRQSDCHKADVVDEFAKVPGLNQELLAVYEARDRIARGEVERPPEIDVLTFCK